VCVRGEELPVKNPVATAHPISDLGLRIADLKDNNPGLRPPFLTKRGAKSISDLGLRISDLKNALTSVRVSALIAYLAPIALTDVRAYAIWDFGLEE
jgi:hypothetical protein